MAQDDNKTQGAQGGDGGTPPGAESGGKPSGVDSASKTPDEAAAQAAVGVPGSEKGAEAAARGVALNHGEPDPRVEEARKQRVESAKDPWGTTPVQMRDKHDEAVDPAKVGVATRPDGSGLVDADGNPMRRPVAHSGLNPAASGDDAPQGTLPPV